MYLEFTLNWYNDEKTPLGNNSKHYPRIRLYDKNVVSVYCDFHINGTKSYALINYSKNGKSFIDPICSFESTRIEGTPLYDLMTEIGELYDVEYDEELFNSYVLILKSLIDNFKCGMEAIISQLIDFLNLKNEQTKYL